MTLRDGIFAPGTDLAEVRLGTAYNAVVAWLRGHRRWVRPVALLGAVYAVVIAIVGDGAAAALDLQHEVEAGDQGGAAEALGRMLATWQATTLLYAPFTAVVEWRFTADALGALRGHRIDRAAMIRAGLLSIAGGLLTTVIALLAAVPIGLLAALAMIVSVPMAIVAALLAGAVAIYAGLRLAFVTPALFDRLSFRDAFRASWDASRGAVGRMLAWWLAGAGVTMLVGIAFGLISGPLAAFHPVAGAFADGLASAIGALFTTTWLVVLYASQRAKSVPARQAWPDGWVRDDRDEDGAAAVPPAATDRAALTDPARPTDPADPAG